MKNFKKNLKLQKEQGEQKVGGTTDKPEEVGDELVSGAAEPWARAAAASGPSVPSRARPTSSGDSISGFRRRLIRCLPTFSMSFYFRGSNPALCQR